jgi:dimethylaniline monooxygenase (N-oxide forming)
VVAAKTYLSIDPSVDLLVIDCEGSVGGVWSESRIYPGLVYQVPAPLMSFTDMDICEELGIEEWTDVAGGQINKFFVSRTFIENHG